MLDLDGSSSAPNAEDSTNIETKQQQDQTTNVSKKEANAIRKQWELSKFHFNSFRIKMKDKAKAKQPLSEQNEQSEEETLQEEEPQSPPPRAESPELSMGNLELRDEVLDESVPTPQDIQKDEDPELMVMKPLKVYSRKPRTFVRSVTFLNNKKITQAIRRELDVFSNSQQKTADFFTAKLEIPDLNEDSSVIKQKHHNGRKSRRKRNVQPFEELENLPGQLRPQRKQRPDRLSRGSSADTFNEREMSSTRRKSFPKAVSDESDDDYPDSLGHNLIIKTRYLEIDERMQANLTKFVIVLRDSAMMTKYEDHVRQFGKLFKRPALKQSVNDWSNQTSRRNKPSSKNRMPKPVPVQPANDDLNIRRRGRRKRKVANSSPTNENIDHSQPCDPLPHKKSKIRLHSECASQSSDLDALESRVLADFGDQDPFQDVPLEDLSDSDVFLEDTFPDFVDDETELERDVPELQSTAAQNLAQSQCPGDGLDGVASDVMSSIQTTEELQKCQESSPAVTIDGCVITLGTESTQLYEKDETFDLVTSISAEEPELDDLQKVSDFIKETEEISGEFLDHRKSESESTAVHINADLIQSSEVLSELTCQSSSPLTLDGEDGQSNSTSQTPSVEKESDISPSLIADILDLEIDRLVPEHCQDYPSEKFSSAEPGSATTALSENTNILASSHEFDVKSTSSGPETTKQSSSEITPSFASLSASFDLTTSESLENLNASQVTTNLIETENLTDNQTNKEKTSDEPPESATTLTSCALVCPEIPKLLPTDSLNLESRVQETMQEEQENENTGGNIPKPVLEVVASALILEKSREGQEEVVQPEPEERTVLQESESLVISKPTFHSEDRAISEEPIEAVLEGTTLSLIAEDGHLSTSDSEQRTKQKEECLVSQDQDLNLAQPEPEEITASERTASTVILEPTIQSKDLDKNKETMEPILEEMVLSLAVEDEESSVSTAISEERRNHQPEVVTSDSNLSPSKHNKTTVLLSKGTPIVSESSIQPEGLEMDKEQIEESTLSTSVPEESSKVSTDPNLKQSKPEKKTASQEPDSLVILEPAVHSENQIRIEEPKESVSKEVVSLSLSVEDEESQTKEVAEESTLSAEVIEHHAEMDSNDSLEEDFKLVLQPEPEESTVLKGTDSTVILEPKIQSEDQAQNKEPIEPILGEMASSLSIEDENRTTLADVSIPSEDQIVIEDAKESVLEDVELRSDAEGRNQAEMVEESTFSASAPDHTEVEVSEKDDAVLNLVEEEIPEIVQISTFINDFSMGILESQLSSRKTETENSSESKVRETPKQTKITSKPQHGDPTSKESGSTSISDQQAKETVKVRRSKSLQNLGDPPRLPSPTRDSKTVKKHHKSTPDEGTLSSKSSEKLHKSRHKSTSGRTSEKESPQHRIPALPSSKKPTTPTEESSSKSKKSHPEATLDKLAGKGSKLHSSEKPPLDHVSSKTQKCRKESDGAQATFDRTKKPSETMLPPSQTSKKSSTEIKTPHKADHHRKDKDSKLVKCHSESVLNAKDLKIAKRSTSEETFVREKSSQRIKKSKHEATMAPKISEKEKRSSLEGKQPSKDSIHPSKKSKSIDDLPQKSKRSHHHELPSRSQEKGKVETKQSSKDSLVHTPKKSLAESASPHKVSSDKSKKSSQLSISPQKSSEKSKKLSKETKQVSKDFNVHHPKKSKAETELPVKTSEKFKRAHQELKLPEKESSKHSILEKRLVSESELSKRKSHKAERSRSESITIEKSGSSKRKSEPDVNLITTKTLDVKKASSRTPEVIKKPTSHHHKSDSTRKSLSDHKRPETSKTLKTDSLTPHRLSEEKKKLVDVPASSKESESTAKSHLKADSKGSDFDRKSATDSNSSQKGSGKGKTSTLARAVPHQKTSEKKTTCPEGESERRHSVEVLSKEKVSDKKKSAGIHQSATPEAPHKKPIVTPKSKEREEVCVGESTKRRSSDSTFFHKPSKLSKTSSNESLIIQKEVDTSKRQKVHEIHKEKSHSESNDESSHTKKEKKSSREKSEFKRKSKAVHLPKDIAGKRSSTSSDVSAIMEHPQPVLDAEVGKVSHKSKTKKRRKHKHKDKSLRRRSSHKSTSKDTDSSTSMSSSESTGTKKTESKAARGQDAVMTPTDLKEKPAFPYLLEGQRKTRSDSGDTRTHFVPSPSSASTASSYFEMAHEIMATDPDHRERFDAETFQEGHILEAAMPLPPIKPGLQPSSLSVPAKSGTQIFADFSDSSSDSNSMEAIEMETVISTIANDSNEDSNHESERCSSKFISKIPPVFMRKDNLDEGKELTFEGKISKPPTTTLPPLGLTPLESTQKSDPICGPQPLASKSLTETSKFVDAEPVPPQPDKPPTMEQNLRILPCQKELIQFGKAKVVPPRSSLLMSSEGAAIPNIQLMVAEQMLGCSSENLAALKSDKSKEISLDHPEDSNETFPDLLADDDSQKPDQGWKEKSNAKSVSFDIPPTQKASDENRNSFTIEPKSGKETLDQPDSPVQTDPPVQYDSPMNSPPDLQIDEQAEESDTLYSSEYDLTVGANQEVSTENYIESEETSEGEGSAIVGTTVGQGESFSPHVAYVELRTIPEQNIINPGELGALFPGRYDLGGLQVAALAEEVAYVPAVTSSAEQFQLVQANFPADFNLGSSNNEVSLISGETLGSHIIVVPSDMSPNLASSGASSHIEILDAGYPTELNNSSAAPKSTPSEVQRVSFIPSSSAQEHSFGYQVASLGYQGGFNMSNENQHVSILSNEGLPQQILVVPIEQSQGLGKDSATFGVVNPRDKLKLYQAPFNLNTCRGTQANKDRSKLVKRPAEVTITKPNLMNSPQQGRLQISRPTLESHLFRIPPSSQEPPSAANISASSAISPPFGNFHSEDQQPKQKQKYSKKAKYDDSIQALGWPTKTRDHDPSIPIVTVGTITSKNEDPHQRKGVPPPPIQSCHPVTHMAGFKPPSAAPQSQILDSGSGSHQAHLLTSSVTESSNDYIGEKEAPAVPASRMRSVEPIISQPSKQGFHSSSDSDNSSEDTSSVMEDQGETTDLEAEHYEKLRQNELEKPPPCNCIPEPLGKIPSHKVFLLLHRIGYH